MHCPPSWSASRRRLLGCAAAALATGWLARPARAADTTHPRYAWFLEARRMQQLAASWGDQPYGAVVVVAGQVVGFGPSRVVLDNDTNAHAERIAIRDAQRVQARARLVGAVLYSTSRPCAACELAAAQAGILRMFHGDALHDAGVPRQR